MIMLLRRLGAWWDRQCESFRDPFDIEWPDDVPAAAADRPATDRG